MKDGDIPAELIATGTAERAQPVASGEFDDVCGQCRLVGTPTGTLRWVDRWIAMPI
ncbi:hypothetical protein IG197_33365 (plasmid) [Aminobacter sp. SR38]|jgi:hypothetical protein|uniref:hypothetical protein n=1 Tax=Aminobacter sp. SR38 TaxID=2774562 RepID=UPI0017814A9F|nr:hypothetical protein [Aminobacter sp. SR38]QOF75581.1 hypothetical protein IG197_33365 [Aminobacter sp. SR38]